MFDPTEGAPALKTWKIGIIGAGGISEQHLEAINLEPRVTAAAIADVSLETARLRASRHQIPAVYSDYREMLQREEMDAVIVCVPNFLHAPVTLAALASGKHVLCEKPMAVTVEQAESMAEMAKRTGNVLMVAQNNRFRSHSQLLKQLMEQERLGQVYHVKTGWVRRKGVPGWGSWFTRQELSGGGALIDIGVHVLDLALWLLDYPRPVSVFGKTYANFGPHKKALSPWGTVREDGTFDVEDFATALITFENGATLALEAGWAGHIEGERIYCELQGTGAGAAIDFDKESITLYHDINDAPTDSKISTSKYNERCLLLANFIDAMEGKAAPVCLPEQGVTVTRIIDAIYRSSRTGQPTHLS
jgi:predicted dehydrogenase